MCDKNDNYFYINQNENVERIWTNKFRGNIVKSIYDPKTNVIYQNSMPYNQINNYKQFFNLNKKKENKDLNCKIVNRNLELMNKFD